ncbi:MAG TPA: hypothetical protein VIG99_28895 [Myxococcaceae bacterium]|jgi:hypothetical protein
MAMISDSGGGSARPARPSSASSTSNSSSSSSSGSSGASESNDAENSAEGSDGSNKTDRPKRHHHSSNGSGSGGSPATVAESAASAGEAAEHRASRAADTAERARTEADAMRATQRAEIARNEANAQRQRAQAALEDARQTLRAAPKIDREDARAELARAEAAAARATTASDHADAHALRAGSGRLDSSFDRAADPRATALSGGSGQPAASGQLSPSQTLTATNGSGQPAAQANGTISQQISAEYDRLPPAEQQRVPRDAYVAQRTEEYGVALKARGQATQDVDARITAALDEMGPNSRDAAALQRQRDRLIATATTTAVQDFRDTRDATALADQYRQDPAKWQQVASQFNLPAGTPPSAAQVKDLLQFNRQVETRAQVAADAAVRNLPPSATDADAAAARQAAVAQVQLQAYVDRGAVKPPEGADAKQWVASQAQLAGQEAGIRRSALAQGQDPDAAAATSEALFQARMDAAIRTGEVKLPEGATPQDVQQLKDRQLSQFREAVNLSRTNGLPMADAQARISGAHAIQDLRIAAQVNINDAVQAYNQNTTAVQRGGETIRGWWYGDGVNHLDFANKEFDVIQAKEKEYHQLLLSTNGPLTPDQQQRAAALKQEIESRIDLTTTNVGLNVQHSLEQAARYKPVEAALFQTVYAASSVIPGGVVIGASVKLLLDDLPNGRIRANGNVLETTGDVVLSMAMGAGQVAIGKFDPTHGGTTTLLRAGTAPILEKAAVIALDGGLNAAWAGGSSAVEQLRDPNRAPDQGIDWQRVAIDSAAGFAGSAIGRVAKFGPAAGAPMTLRQLGTQTLRESGLGFVSGSLIDAGTQYATKGEVDLRQAASAGFQNALIAGLDSGALGVGQMQQARRATAPLNPAADPAALTSDPRLRGASDRDTSPIQVRRGQVDPLADNAWALPPEQQKGPRAPKPARAPEDTRLTGADVERGIDFAQAISNFATRGRSTLRRVGDQVVNALGPTTEWTLKGTTELQNRVREGGARLSNWWDDRLGRFGTSTPAQEQHDLLSSINPSLTEGRDPNGRLFAARRGEVDPGGVPLRTDKALGQSDQGSFPLVYKTTRVDDLVNGPRASLPDQLAVFAGRDLAERWTVTEGRAHASTNVADPNNNMFAQSSPQYVPGLVEGENQFRVRVEAYGRTQDVALRLPDADTMKAFYAGQPDAVRQVVGGFQGQIREALANPDPASMRTIDGSTVASAYRQGIPGQRTLLPPVDLQINLRTNGFIDPIRDPGNINFGSGAGETPTNTVKSLYFDAGGKIALIGDRTAHANMDGAGREALINGTYEPLKSFDAALKDPNAPPWRGTEPFDPAQAHVLQEGLDPAQQNRFGNLFQAAPQREVVAYLDPGSSQHYEDQLFNLNGTLNQQAGAAGVRGGPQVTVDWVLAEAMGVARGKNTVDSLAVDPNNTINPVASPVPEEAAAIYTDPDPSHFAPDWRRGERLLAAAQLGNLVDKPTQGKPGSASAVLSSAAHIFEPLLSRLSNLSNPGRAQAVSPYDVSNKGMYSRLPDSAAKGENLVVAFGTASSQHYGDVSGVVKLADGSRRLSVRAGNDGDVALDASVARVPQVADRMMQDIKAYQAEVARRAAAGEPPLRLAMLDYLPARELARIQDK